MGRSIPDLIWWRNFLRNSNHASEYSLNEPCRRSRSHFLKISVPSFERSELGVKKPLVNSPTRDKSLRWCVVGDNEKKNGQEDRNISAKEFPIDCVILVKRFLEETSNDKFQLRWLAHFPLTPPLLPLLIKSSRSKPVSWVAPPSSPFKQWAHEVYIRETYDYYCRWRKNVANLMYIEIWFWRLTANEKTKRSFCAKRSASKNVNRRAWHK